jgi:hypothetical protein
MFEEGKYKSDEILMIIVELKKKPPKNRFDFLAVPGFNVVTVKSEQVFME